MNSGSAPAAGMLGAPAAALRQRGGRWRLRDWRLRTKLTAVLLVPLVLAGVLGALRVAELVHKANDSAALARQVGFVQQLGGVIHDLQGERHRVATMQADGGVVDPAELQTRVQRVDAAVSGLRLANAGSETFPAAASPQWERAHRVALSRLSGLAAFRRATLEPGSAGNAVLAYSELISMLLDLHRQALGGAPDSSAQRADGIKALAIAQEQASWQHAVVHAGILADGLSAEQQVALRTADARFEAAADEFGLASSPDQRQFYFAARAVVDRKRLLDAVLDRTMRAAPLETVPGDWNSAAAGTVETIWQGQSTLLDDLRRDTTARGEAALREAYVNSAVVGFLLLLAVALLVIVVRSLLQPLRALRTAAFEVADRRLPEAVEQLQTADGVPGHTMVDPVPVHSREEVGQVARAVDTVHAQAVRLAAEQAQLRSSLNEVFLSLSGRNHGLLQRQLQLIDEARSHAADPELASRLHQLDRLVARMRRYSENLLVLAGGTVCRGADAPAAVLDVLRDAVWEIEDAARVTVRPPPAATVVGPIVTDLVHLVAELLDNAISVTPPGASVTLGCVLTEDNGLLIEITDAGTGLSADALQTINARLVSAPSADLPSAGRMGLFVVRELAAKHGITVRLRQRLGGSGITASVQLPPSLVAVDLRGPIASPEPDADAPGPLAGQEHPPLRVSVIEDTATDLFSPASIRPASLGATRSQPSPPRAAQQEWLELFGPPEAQPSGFRPKPDPVSDQVGNGAAGDSPVTDTLGIPVPAGTPEVREEIFEMVSAWFRERQTASERDSLTATAPDWRSPFDEGWQAAQALRSPLDHELTQAGLPRRQPRAHLVSGADDYAQTTPAPTAPVRTPEDVRGRLSRYQSGLRVGRHARLSPDDQPAWTETQPRPFGFEYGAPPGVAEEQQQ
ncbi:MAG: sensor histidine kinase [Pseudonocardiaceae bacterium]